MDNAFGNISFKNSEVRNFLLVRLNLVEGGDVVDHTVDPNCLNIGNMG